MTRQVFRQAALDRLASPEQLDRLVTLTDPRGWIALSTVGVLTVATILWGFLGTLPTTVKGQGILLSEKGRLSDAMAPAAGTLSAILPGVGDSVSEGQVIARISQGNLVQQIRNLDDLIAERQAELARKKDGFAREQTIKQRNLDQRRQALTQTLDAANQHAGYLQSLLTQLEQMAAQGISTRQRVQETRTELSKAQREAASARSDLLRLDSEALETRLRQDSELTELDARINDAARQKRELAVRLDEQSVVTAPASGRVIEVKRSTGSVIGVGEPVLTIESGSSRLKTVVFVGTEDGKKIHPGMTVRITPDTVKKEEWGSLTASVRDVSEFPVTTTGMAAILPNPGLIDLLAKKGAPYAVEVDLDADNTSPSGYRWTSGRGPDMILTSGTTVKADVTVERRRPVDLVLPALRKLTGTMP